MRRRSVLAFLALGLGAGGTILELVWFRAFVPVLGNGAWSLAATLSAYMAGLALGGRFVGRWGDRVRRPRRALSALAVAAGLMGWAAPWLMRGMETIASPLLEHLEPGALALHATRFVLAAAAMLPATAMLGGGLPFLLRLARGASTWGRSLGVLYGLETAGAVLGVVWAGFFAIETWGLSTTLLHGAALLAVVAAAAGALPPPPDPEPAAPAAGAPAPPPSARRLAALAVALSGLTMTACEVLWGRILYFLLGNDGHAVPYMLATYLGGLAAGGVLHGAMLAGSARPLRWLGRLLGAQAAVVFVTFQLAGAWYVEKGVYVGRLLEDHHANLAACRIVYALLVVFLPGVLAGATFALATEITGRGRVGKSTLTGRAVAANALGAVAGAVSPLLAMRGGATVQATLVAHLAAFALLAGACLAASRRERSRRWVAAAAPVAILAALAACLPNDVIARMTARGQAHAERLFYAESMTSSVSVWRDRIDGSKRLYVNQVSEVPTNLESIHCFELLGHLPLLVHDRPREVLMITFGGGIASGAVASHDIERLDVVDIEAGVFRAAVHFRNESRSVLDDPRVHPWVEDGRNFLRRARRSFDVIISDSTHPRSADSWVLYTREFYEQTRRHLRDGGVMAQWLPLHSLSLETYATIVATFRTAYPHASLWYSKDYSVLLGTTSPLALDAATLRTRLAEPRVREDLARAHLDDLARLLGCFVTGERGLARLSEGRRPSTDDWPHTHYSRLELLTYPDIAAALNRVREPVSRYLAGSEPSPELDESLDRAARAQAAVIEGDLARAVELAPADPRLAEYAEAAARRGDYLLRKLDYHPDDLDLHEEVAGVYAARGDHRRALAHLDTVVAGRPESARAWFRLALEARACGRLQRAEQALRRVTGLEPDLPAAWGELGLVLLQRGRRHEARKMFARVLELDPDDEQARMMLRRTDGRRHRRSE